MEICATSESAIHDPIDRLFCHYKFLYAKYITSRPQNRVTKAQIDAL